LIALGQITQCRRNISGSLNTRHGRKYPRFIPSFNKPSARSLTISVNKNDVNAVMRQVNRQVACYRGFSNTTFFSTHQDYHPQPF
jgi:hypothetical protein